MQQSSVARSLFEMLISELRRSRPRRLRVHNDSKSSLTAELLETRQLLTSDAVIDWNNILLDAIRFDKTAPPAASRAMAIVQTAVFDAVNSIEAKYEPYLVQLSGYSNASPDAAVAAAAHKTLLHLFPAQAASLNETYQEALAAIPNGNAENKGVQLGEAVASQILLLRANDGASTVVTYTPGSDPGDWRPTPNGFQAAVLPQWPNVTTFGVVSGSQFIPAAPPTLDSVQYAQNLAEVQSLGAANSTTRTADQTDIAKFWAGGPGTATPPGQWNMIAQAIAENRGNSLLENARMFAVLDVCLADAAITCWTAKYEYELWRPVTAIREADTDGNDTTTPDTTWLPLLNTPAFPSYSSGHSTFSGAASTALAAFFGTDDIAFTVPSEVNGVASRSYVSLTDAAEEAGRSRIYGGIHYEFDNQTGLNSGRQIAGYVTSLRMRPVIRINAGGPAVSGSTSFAKDTGYQNGAGRIVTTRAAINMAGAQNYPQSVFQSNLWDAAGGRNLKFAIPATRGARYRVEILASEIQSSGFRTGARVFDVLADGQVRIDNLDVFAEAGANKALVKSFELTADGEINLELVRQIGNPSIAGIVVTEIESAPNTAPVLALIPDQTVNAGRTISIPLSVHDAENDALTFTVFADAPSVVSGLRVVGPVNNRRLELTPGTSLGATTVTLAVSDGLATTTQTFDVSSLLKLNVGGGSLAGNPDFVGDGRYRNTGLIYSTRSSINVGSTGLPQALFQVQVFDVASGPELEYSIPLSAGSSYRIDLMFAEIWSGAFGVGRRKFDVLADGVLKLKDLDVFAEAGANTALVKSFEIISDGLLNLKFLHGVQNPMIAGIQVTKVTGPGGGIGTTSTRLASPDLFGDDDIDSLFGDSGATL